MAVNKNILYKISELTESFEKIPPTRKKLLKELSEYITAKVRLSTPINLIFICTHNSRRSHMCQIWAQTASEYYNIPHVYCYSGGTEETAFNSSAVEAVKQAGFKTDKEDNSANPIYLIYYSDKKKPMRCFSKVYSHPFNPQKEFAAIMTCSDAEKNCPFITGAENRFSVPYEDPKIFDNTNLEKAKYIERFEEIGREMLFVFYSASIKGNIKEK